MRKTKSVPWSFLTPRLLHDFGKPMTSRMILDKLQSQNIALDIPIGKLSSALFKQCTAGMMSSIKVKGLKGRFYALPQWFDENGKLKVEHKPDGYNL